MTRTAADAAELAGFRLDLDASVRESGDGVLRGGTPLHYLRLSAAGVRAWVQLQDHAVASAAESLLARRLLDAGLAHPVPPPPAGPADVTVVVPVLDRPRELARCLRALGRAVPLVVVDDGSADPDAIATVAAEHGARVVRRAVNGGPGAARNTGLETVDTGFVAFLDSDCEPPAGWLALLLAHLADPAVAAVAPRIVGSASSTAAGRYAAARGALDLGPRPSRVRAGARVAYVPTAALVARVSALREVARDGRVFDPTLRYGEDVDLVWRLDAAGWRVRYQPEVRVTHHEPNRWAPLLTRRWRYGTSAVPLAAAHPRCTSPLVLAPWPALSVAALLARRPLPAAIAYGAGACTTRRRLRRADLSTDGVATATAQSVHRTWLAVGRYVTQFAAPVALAAVALPGAPGRRLAAASLLLGGPLTSWWSRRQALDPARFTAGYLADEISYGAGVWSAAVRCRDLRALRPRVVRRSFGPPAPRSVPTKESVQ